LYFWHFKNIIRKEEKMGKGFKIYLVVSILLVIGGSFLIASNNSKEVAYDGNTFRHEIKGYWKLNIDSENPYTMSLGGTSPFLLENQEGTIKGQVNEVPLGLEGDWYYYFSDQFTNSESWQIKDAEKTEIKVEGENIEVNLLPTEISKRNSFFNSLAALFFIWLILTFFTIMVIPD
jgi:hypothetical protein